METASETVTRINRALSAGGAPSTETSPKPQSRTNPLIDVLTERLTKQGTGIVSSASSDLQASINDAIASTQIAGDLGAERLISERDREVAFAQDRAGATYSQALESRTGYATQVAGLRELTETTEKSIRDLDKRYQESILANDAATAQRIADLKVKKLEFQQEQEQNFFNNLLSLGNLQQQAIQQQQQDEQFWVKKKQDDEQFVAQMSQSSYEFEKNYGLALQDFGLKEQQLELERQRFNLSAREYADRKAALTADKARTQTQAIIANDIKNKFATGGFTKEQFMDTNYMATVADMTGFDGTTEELSSIILAAYSDVNNAGIFTEAPAVPSQPSAFQSDLSALGSAINKDSWLKYMPIVGDFGLGGISKTTQNLQSYFTQPR